MWDRDVLSANDIIAETSIDLYRWFLKVRLPGASFGSPTPMLLIYCWCSGLLDLGA